MEQGHCRLITQRYDKLTFKGISPGSQPISLGLADVYVELRAVADVADSADTFSSEERRILIEGQRRGQDGYELRTQLDSLRTKRWYEESRQGQHRRRSIEDCLADPGHATLVILGDPGCGKSTLLHYLALQTARSTLEAADAHRPQIVRAWPPDTRVLPIFVPLAAYDEHLRRGQQATSLADFLALYYESWCNQPGLAPMFAQALASGRALVLMDGLDEVLDLGTRHHVAEQVRALIHQHAGKGNRFVLTSRIVGYREAPIVGVPHVTVMPFGHDEIAAFAQKWCRAFEVWSEGKPSEVALQHAANEERALLRDVHSNPSVTKLAESPLLLTMLALLRRQIGALPDRRIELYRQYIDALMSHRQHTRSEGARLRAPERFDLHQARNHLMELALWLQENRPSGTACRQDLLTELTRICLRYSGHDPDTASPKARGEAEKQAESFIADASAMSGLLTERGQDAYGFWHLTFQEYFVARALARMSADQRWQRIAPHLYQQRWREPIFLCAGQLGVVEGRRAEASQLVQRILHAKSEHERLLHRDAFLAADVAADDVGLEAAVQDALCERLVALRQSEIRLVRWRALRGLVHLARLEHERAIQALVDELRGQQTAEVLRALGPALQAQACAGLRSQVLDKLDDQEPGMSIPAIYGLSTLIHSDQEVRAAILGKLDGEVPGISIAAVRVLGSLVETDAEIRAVLVGMLKGKPEWIRGAVIDALRPMVKSDEEIRALVRDELRRTKSSNLYEAVRALTPFVETDEEIRAALIDKLQQVDEENDWLRIPILESLRPLVETDNEIRTIAVKFLATSEPLVREAAVRMLGGLTETDEQIRKVLICMLDDSSNSTSAVAIETLGSLVDIDEQITKDLLSRFQYESVPSSRTPMLRAVAPLVSTDVSVQRAVVGALDEPSPETRAEALNSLSPKMKTKEKLRSKVFSMLDDQNHQVRASALQALISEHKPDENVHRKIFSMLDDQNYEVRTAALRALVSTGIFSEELRTRVINMLDDQDFELRGSALHALMFGENIDEPVYEKIISLLDDEDPIIRASALQVLISKGHHNQKVRSIVLNILDEQVPYEGVFLRLSTDLLRDEEILRKLMSILDGPNEESRERAILMLAPLASKNNTVQNQILRALDESTLSFAKSAAVKSLAPVITSNSQVKERIYKMLDTNDDELRAAAVSALAQLVVEDENLASRLLPYLGATSRDPLNLSLRDRYWAEELRAHLAKCYGPLLAINPELYKQVYNMLESPSWQKRQGASWALLAMPDGPPTEALPMLRGLLTDLRGEESLADRLAAAAVFLNHRDSAMSNRAVHIALEALAYGREFFYLDDDGGRDIRIRAANILAKLDPIYRDEAIFDRLACSLEDPDVRVRDSAYQALLHLATAPEDTHAPEMTAESRPSLPAKRALMQPLTVLHLSDLHIDQTEQAQRWHNQLAEDLRHELGCTRLDGLILSGDIANKSTTEEYEAAKHFIAELCEEFAISRQQIVLVPGNHDLNWELSEEAYTPVRRKSHRGLLAPGCYIGEDNAKLVEIRDDDLYKERFRHFADFYESVTGKAYSLDYKGQVTLTHFSTHGLLVAGFNSAWQIDHHFKARAGIHPDAISNALSRIRKSPTYSECPLKLAVWHHPLDSAGEDRIKDQSFMEQLAKSGFSLALHGHVHKADNKLFRYDRSPTGRRIEIVVAGTFGAPVRQWVPGYPLQYNLLRFASNTLTVETRRREEVNGAWKPDARWTEEPGQDPRPRYQITF